MTAPCPDCTLPLCDATGVCHETGERFADPQPEVLRGHVSRLAVELLEVMTTTHDDLARGVGGHIMASGPEGEL